MGTWNLLHPAYVLKYGDIPEGLAPNQNRESRGRKCNWRERAPEISARLLEGKLDIYLLQEVGEEQLADLMAPNSTLAAMYEAVHTLHPGKGASGRYHVATTDGVAVLLRRARLCIEGHDHVDIMHKHKEEVYQHSLLVGARDVETDTQVPKVN